MSDTPRTDALTSRLYEASCYSAAGGMVPGGGGPEPSPEECYTAAIELCRDLERELSQPHKSGTESVARWMIAHGYTTGHGDDLEDLLPELVRQVMESHKPGPSRCKDCGADVEPEFPDESPPKVCKRCKEAQSGEPL